MDSFADRQERSDLKKLRQSNRSKDCDADRPLGLSLPTAFIDQVRVGRDMVDDRLTVSDILDVRIHCPRAVGLLDFLICL
jgi:hypothetical protein